MSVGGFPDSSIACVPLPFHSEAPCLRTAYLLLLRHFLNAISVSSTESDVWAPGIFDSVNVDTHLLNSNVRCEVYAVQ